MKKCLKFFLTSCLMAMIFGTTSLAAPDERQVQDMSDSFIGPAEFYANAWIPTKTKRVFYLGEQYDVQEDEEGNKLIYVEYKVNPGDCLWYIYKRTGCSVEEIMKFNNLSSTIIYPEQIIVVPIPIDESSWDYLTGDWN